MEEIVMKTEASKNLQLSLISVHKKVVNLNAAREGFSKCTSCPVGKKPCLLLCFIRGKDHI